MNKFCQSCGMPMKKDTKTGGTNADGSKSEGLPKRWTAKRHC
jgi:hypothetical protein